MQYPFVVYRVGGDRMKKELKKGDEIKYTSGFGSIFKCLIQDGKNGAPMITDIKRIG